MTNEDELDTAGTLEIRIGETSLLGYMGKAGRCIFKRIPEYEKILNEKQNTKESYVKTFEKLLNRLCIGNTFSEYSGFYNVTIDVLKQLVIHNASENDLHEMPNVAASLDNLKSKHNHQILNYERRAVAFQNSAEKSTEENKSEDKHERLKKDYVDSIVDKINKGAKGK